MISKMQGKISEFYGAKQEIFPLVNERKVLSIFLLL
jgi:hypothetical protein